ncbi:MAG TPA: hypothetical protein VNX68_16155 [Nitrosopumilaceae archaeon]|jgi:hypothetical protein|nr:hypothetical protein [Nitrosopumilaceae archaeon]
MEKILKKPQIRVNRYQNGFWIHNYNSGVLCANKAEGIAEIKKLFPDIDYEVIDVLPHEKHENPRLTKEVADLSSSSVVSG